MLRGSYHLYQGFGGFLGNAVMGVLFGYFYQRTRRVLPLAIAHTIVDTRRVEIPERSDISWLSAPARMARPNHVRLRNQATAAITTGTMQTIMISADPKKARRTFTTSLGRR